MENTLMKKDGVEILIESTVISNKLKDLKSIIVETLNNKYKIESFEKPDIVEFRNDKNILNITDTENFVNSNMKKLSESILNKKVTLDEALTEVFKINLTTGKNYNIEDLYKNIKYLKEDSSINITFDSVNSDIVNTYRKTLEKKSECLSMSLYEDLFDSEITENLTILGMTLNNLL